MIPHRRLRLMLGSSILLVGIGFAAGYLAKMVIDNSIFASMRDSFIPIEQKGTDYTFIHPLLAYRIPEATLLGEYQGLDTSFQAIISHARAAGGATRAAVYFRDLDAGRWVGVNQNDTYYPASLLKVPVMIAYEKQSEEDPSVLARNLTYDPSAVPDVPFEATSTLVAGNAYSVQSLIHSMIIDSDNGATFTLLAAIDPDFLNEVYTALGITNPGDDSSEYQISARTYALFFRILYNATYLSQAASERALALLAQSTFSNGLAAGVPQGTVVAHKYGEHVLSQGGVMTGVELSDCGIVYYPAHPYLLCVMTSADTVPAADALIANLSRAAYGAVAARYATSTNP